MILKEAIKIYAMNTFSVSEADKKSQLTNVGRIEISHLANPPCTHPCSSFEV